MNLPGLRKIDCDVAWQATESGGMLRVVTGRVDVVEGFDAEDVSHVLASDLFPRMATFDRHYCSFTPSHGGRRCVFRIADQELPPAETGRAAA